jgi:hypothetical protein
MVLKPGGSQISAFADLSIADSGIVGVMEFAIFHVAHPDKIETPRRHRRFKVQVRVVALVEADGLAREIAQLLDRRWPMNHRGSGNEIDRWARRHRAGEAMIDDVRSVEEEQIIGAVSDAREGFVGTIKMELDPALGPKERRADRAAKVEIEAGGRVVGRLADQARTRDAAAANDA